MIGYCKAFNPICVSLLDQQSTLLPYDDSFTKLSDYSTRFTSLAGLKPAHPWSVALSNSEVGNSDIAEPRSINMREEMNSDKSVYSSIHCIA